MQKPIQITIKNVDPSDQLNALIKEKANKLQQFNENIISCHITVEQTQRHKHQGKLNNLRINISVPGKELIVTHNPNENIYVAVRDAFDDARRQLENYSQISHGGIKTHPNLLHGKIVRLFEDFGFIEGTDGEEYYFNADNLVSSKFNKLKLGFSVRFIEAMGQEGLQAHHVSVHHEKQ